MAISLAQSKHRQADEAAQALAAGVAEIDSILLFGSVARGDAGAESDIDLLVVSSEPLSGRTMRSHLAEHPLVSLVSHTWESLQEAREMDWSFFVHLKEEGQLLHGSERLEAELDLVEAPPLEKRRESLLEELHSLERFDDLKRFRAGYTFPLANIFISARYTCMLDNTADGAVAFSRAEAFSLYAERHPEAADDAAFIATVWPFHARTLGREATVPFDEDDEKAVGQALRSTRRILRAAIDG
jgi:predicted nucleotidyltransferase